MGEGRMPKRELPGTEIFFENSIVSLPVVSHLPYLQNFQLMLSAGRCG